MSRGAFVRKKKFPVIFGGITLLYRLSPKKEVLFKKFFCGQKRRVMVIRFSLFLFLSSVF